ncbi:hypothetical protein RB195_021387 [Necator americanus]|uniref:Uncharacterized protein n=1 Tax=Necator americanus TaxID=51031 RepID=A0ABR1EB36_NECAM
MPASSTCRTHHRRVNPRFSVFRSFDHENTFYCDEEIPVTRRMNSGILPLNPRTNRFSLDGSIENDYLQSFEIPAVVAEDESEDNYILLRTIQPKIKIALIQTQDVWRSSGFRKNKKRPMLSKDPGLKYYSRRVQHAIPESPIEGDSVEDSNLSSLSLNSPSSNDADESSYENDQSPERVPVKNSNTGGSKVSTHSYITRRVRFASKYKNTTSSSNLKLSKSLRNKSLYGALGMSGTMPRRLSRMLLSFGNDSIKKKSIPIIPQMEYDEFNRITRKYSREIVKNVLFVPSDEIRIVRLSKERFFSSEEIVDVLLECSSVKQDHNNSSEVTNNEPSDDSGLKVS